MEKVLRKLLHKLYAADLLPSRDLYFRSHDSLIPNNPPVNLNSIGPLVVSENQPIGTMVASFAAMDPEGGPLSFVTYPSPPVDLNPELWLDASSFQNLDLLAGKVRTWTDLSAGSKQANQFEVSRMPTFDKAERGIFFDGWMIFLMYRVSIHRVQCRFILYFLIYDQSTIYLK